MPSMTFDMFPPSTAVSILPKTAGEIGEVPRVCGTGVLRQDGLSFPGGSMRNLRPEYALASLDAVGAVAGGDLPAVPKTRMELLSSDLQVGRQVPETRVDLTQHQQHEHTEQHGGYGGDAVAIPQAAQIPSSGSGNLIDQIQGFGFSREDAEEA